MATCEYYRPIKQSKSRELGVSPSDSKSSNHFCAFLGLMEGLPKCEGNTCDCEVPSKKEA